MNSTFIPPKGGTELLVNGLLKYINPTQYGVNLILSENFQLSPGQPRAINWEHRNVDEPGTKCLQDKSFTDPLSAIVLVSNWQAEKFRNTTLIPLAKTAIIRNAIEPIQYVKKPIGKLKLVYTSTPWRGLDVLLDVFEQLNRDDVELDVYSSTIIYGSAFYEKHNSTFEKMFDRAKAMPGVNYMGYTSNDDIRKALQQSHILAYPSTFEETSCLAVIEAGAAGCSIVTTNLGALPETSCGWARMTPMQNWRGALLERYKTNLNNAINNYWSEEGSGKFEKQSEFFNAYYSWDAVIPEWKRLFTAIK
jgi:glycosyltransferase involved in cell wall biosynthesis